MLIWLVRDVRGNRATREKIQRAEAQIPANIVDVMVIGSVTMPQIQSQPQISV